MEAVLITQYQVFLQQDTLRKKMMFLIVVIFAKTYKLQGLIQNMIVNGLNKIAQDVKCMVTNFFMKFRLG